MKKSFILKGGIAFSDNKDNIISYEKGYLVCIDGKVKSVLDAEKPIPEDYIDFPVLDYSDYLIVPGMIDLHVHAPQYTNRGIGMDLELLEWLNTYTFPEEAKYSDLQYAKNAYSYFVNDLRRSFTTRAVIFATIHNRSTKMLMDELENSGVYSYVGRVNMDRNGGENLQEESAQVSLTGTGDWLEETANLYKRTYPILTPRFVPSCSDELLEGLGKLAEEKNLRIQSHLSENTSEVAWVKELVPQAVSYGNAYEIFGNMGTPDRPTIMAHCVYSDDAELEILKSHGAYVAHCPDSNLNLTSGIAPVRKMLDKGIDVGLGTDVSGGSSLNMVKTMLCALQSSKMYYKLVDTRYKPLTFEEVFYMATEGGGKYFGKVGSFKPGFEFDAVIIDDRKMQSMKHLTVRERVERLTYNDADCIIRDKFAGGRRVFENPMN